MKKVVYSPDAIEKIQKIERQVRAEYGDNTARKVKKAITARIRSLQTLEEQGVSMYDHPGAFGLSDQHQRPKMEDICILHSDLEPYHSSFFVCISVNRFSSLAEVYKCLHADYDFCRDSLHSCAFRRRLQKSHAVRERVVSSHTVSDTVRQFLSVLGTALFSMGHPGHYYIRVWDHHVGHELERPF